MPDTLTKPRPTKLEWLLSRIDKARHTKEVGWLGEQIIMEALPKDRYTCWQPLHRLDGDLHITERSTGSMIRVEVKAARINKRKKFEFKLRKHDQYGETDIGHADLVIFICFWEGLMWFYVVPVGKLPGKSATIPLHDNNSKFRPYRLASLSRLVLPEVCYA